MWTRPQFLPAARMPSTRSQPLNPRLGAPQPGAAKSSRTSALPKALSGAAAPDPAADEAAEAARAGGFHESSYELRNGLDVNESEWPPDTTIPGPPGER